MGNTLYTKTYGKKAYTALKIALMVERNSLAAFSENAVGHRAGEVKSVISFQKHACYSVLIPVMAADDEVVIVDPDFIPKKTTLRMVRSKLKKVIAAAEALFGQDEKLYFFPRSFYDWGIPGNEMPVRDGVTSSLADNHSPAFLEELLKKYYGYMMVYGRWPYASTTLTREDGITIREMKHIAQLLLHPTREEKLDDEMKCLKREMLMKDFILGCASFFRAWGRRPASSFTPRNAMAVVGAEDPMKTFKEMTEELVSKWRGVSDLYKQTHEDPVIQLRDKLVDPELPQFIETIKMLRDPELGMPSIEVIISGYQQYRETYLKEN